MTERDRLTLRVLALAAAALVLQVAVAVVRAVLAWEGGA